MNGSAANTGLFNDNLFTTPGSYIVLSLTIILCAVIICQLKTLASSLSIVSTHQFVNQKIT